MIQSLSMEGKSRWKLD